MPCRGGTENAHTHNVIIRYCVGSASELAVSATAIDSDTENCSDNRCSAVTIM